MRQIVLDTETTGLDPDKGHRIIEVGCIELVNRKLSGNNYWCYFNPERVIDAGAVAVHGLTNEFLADKALFHQQAQTLWDYLAGAELIIHNAAFDVGFLEWEFRRCGRDAPLASICTITDTVAMARKLHPGQRNSLDALCRRYEIDNSNRTFHGAQLDAQLLADVYLIMTGGQSQLGLEAATGHSASLAPGAQFLLQLQSAAATYPPVILPADEAALLAHQARLEYMKKKGKCLWPNE